MGPSTARKSGFSAIDALWTNTHYDIDEIERWMKLMVAATTACHRWRFASNCLRATPRFFQSEAHARPSDTVLCGNLARPFLGLAGFPQAFRFKAVNSMVGVGGPLVGDRCQLGKDFFLRRPSAQARRAPGR